jgi:hypothetical protein
MKKPNFENEDKKLANLEQLERAVNGTYGPRKDNALPLSHDLLSDSLQKEGLTETFIQKIN